MKPSRIISLVPSLTEFVVDVGAGDALIGRTRFCIHPANKVDSIPIVGGTKNPKIDTIQALHPDLVIMNREENRQVDAEQIEAFAPVLMTDISTIDEAIVELARIGVAIGCEDETQRLLDEIISVLPKKDAFSPGRVAYLIWRNPWMAVGSSTYIDNVLERFGLINVFADKSRYPEITLEELASAKPDCVLLSSEPFPFKQKHIDEIKNEIAMDNILIVDGEWFSWYGSRMLPAFRNITLWRNNMLK